jgi:hypothetical protein
VRGMGRESGRSVAGAATIGGTPTNTKMNVVHSVPDSSRIVCSPEWWFRDWASLLINFLGTVSATLRHWDAFHFEVKSWSNLGTGTEASACLDRRLAFFQQAGALSEPVSKVAG